jgi:hypothetical protein
MELLDRAENSSVLLERACAALAVLVRVEYPSDRSLAEIATTWGEGISEEQIEALKWFEGQDPNSF